MLSWRALAVALALTGYALLSHGLMVWAADQPWLVLVLLGQHAGIHLALAGVFAATLRRGATPLITTFALRLHRSVTPALLQYTRRVTWLWSAYFGAMVVLSLGLFAVAPWWWWSVFANLVTPVAAVALFVGEYLVRYRLHPEFERITLQQALQAYRDTRLIEARRP
jgi:uncharacterized membrane protein